MAPTFGSRVIGEDAYDKAVRTEKAGGNVFGARVVGAITGDGPIATAKRATEHGPLVVAGAQQSDTKGAPSDSVSIDELRNILAENPTFLDSLYEAELAREDGPRPEALHIIREVERGIKGAARPEILREIAQLLGETAQVAAQRADLNAGFLKQREEQAKREEENKALRDADRLKALRERQENLDAVEKAGGDPAEADAANAVMDTAAKARELGGVKAAQGGAPATVPTKPDGPVHAETQSPGTRPFVPKAGQDGEVADGEGEAGDSSDIAQQVENATVEELKEFLGDDELAKLREKGGSGADGAVVKADLVKAAKRKARSSGSK
jgi:hypothetical protein